LICRYPRLFVPAYGYVIFLGRFTSPSAKRLFLEDQYVSLSKWRELHNEELRDLYFLPYIERVVKSRRMRWAGHVARLGEGRGVHRVLVGKPEGRDHWGDTDVDGRIILRLIFGKWDGVETGWS